MARQLTAVLRAPSDPASRLIHAAAPNTVIQDAATVAEVIEQSGLVTFILEGKEARRLIGDFQDKPGVDYAGFFGAALHVSGRNRDSLEKAIAPYRGRPGLDVREEAPSLEDVFIQLQEEA